MPCMNISVLSKTKFQGDFDIETLEQALLTIPGVSEVRAMANDFMQVDVNIAGCLQTAKIQIQKGGLLISGLGRAYLEKKVPQYYNALVQTRILRRMGFNTKVEARGENIVVQAVK